MTTVNTTCGQLRGSNEDGLAVFRGVPYASPPVGDLRWMPPAPPAPWSGVRDALAFASAAPQEKSALLPPLMTVEQTESEDCLYLNVWTPAADCAARPVMFWIHGGGFYLGAGSQALYDGRHLAARDVVVVTINYRMGAFGFVHLAGPTNGRIPATGNEGLLDQVAALEWVRTNIAAFGGDPDNVTIFGESAGGMSVASLMTMPRARGLFHKAIVQSGPGHTNFSVDESIRLMAEPMLDALGNRDPDHLRGITTDAAQSAMPTFLAAVSGGDITTFNHWAKPVVDDEIIVGWPEAVLAVGAHAGLALMVGTTRDEMAKPVDPVFEDEQLLERVGLMMPSVDALGLVGAFREARGARLAPVDARSLFAAIHTHRTMTVPSTRLLDAHRPHGPAFHYIFDWMSPAMDGANGAQHGIDTGFVFGTHNSSPDYAAAFGGGPAADALANAVMDAWVAFAANGDPSTASLGAWPAYGAARETMMIGPNARVVDAPFEAERLAWQGIATADMR
jgi:para-nitrobenzyl esterase